MRELPGRRHALEGPRFPAANHGAEVRAVERSVAADAPMAAAVLAALDVPTMLLANDVGNDSISVEVSAWLQRHGMMTTANVTAATATPLIVVMADGWLAYVVPVSSRCRPGPGQARPLPDRGCLIRVRRLLPAHRGGGCPRGRRAVMPPAAGPGSSHDDLAFFMQL